MACEKLVRYEKFYPTPATIIEYIDNREPYQEPVVAIEYKMSPDELLKRRLTALFFNAWMYEADPVKAKALVDGTQGPEGLVALDKFRTDHWHDDLDAMIADRGDPKDILKSMP